MVAMGRALMSHPKLLLMDEPSMGLAPILVERSFEIIQQVNESGVAMLVVEQNANMALSIADRGYVLSTGRLVLEGQAKELLAHEDLRKAYFGPIANRTCPAGQVGTVPGRGAGDSCGRKVTLSAQKSWPVAAVSADLQSEHDHAADRDPR